MRLMTAVGEQAAVPSYAAFLDLAEPDLTSVARTLAAAGHRSAVVVPLLFTEAFHATVDVPEAVRGAAADSGLELSMAGILGTGDDVAALLGDRLAGLGVADSCSVLLYAVGSSRPEANEAVDALAARLAGSRTGEVRAAFGTCDPRPAEMLATLRGPVALLPLFLADGLLLGPLRTLVAEHGWPMAEPLGEQAAALVLSRYEAARAAVAAGSPG